MPTDRRPPCIGCGRDCAPRQVYCNRCRKALRLEGAGQGRRYGFRMMDSPEADLPRMSDELREMLRDPGAMNSQAVKDLLDKLTERLANEGFINPQQPPQVTPPPQTSARGQLGQPQGRQTEVRFEITDKTIDFLGFKTLQDLLGSLGRSSFGRHDTRDLATGVESGGVSRPYEFGDTLNMDISATLFNAVRREGAKEIGRTHV